MCWMAVLRPVSGNSWAVEPFEYQACDSGRVVDQEMDIYPLGRRAEFWKLLWVLIIYEIIDLIFSTVKILSIYLSMFP